MTMLPKSPAFDPTTVEARTGTSYPEAFQKAAAGRVKRRLGEHGGLSGFGVNLVTLVPGCSSSVRHWHTHEDEFVMVMTGELILLTSSGEQLLGPGMCAAFPAGRADGHALVNRSATEATYLEIGDRVESDEVEYPDVDMQMRYIDGDHVFVRRSDGSRYE